MIFKINCFENFYFFIDLNFYTEGYYEIFSKTFKHLMILLLPRDFYEEQLYHRKIHCQNLKNIFRKGLFLTFNFFFPFIRILYLNFISKDIVMIFGNFQTFNGNSLNSMFLRGKTVLS